jgi:predicted SAM-dependent methyltransferase
MSASTAGSEEPFRLHIGGVEPRPPWRIFNIQPGPGVDFVGDCTDLSQFADESVDEIYASHVLEHLDHKREIPKALKELHRILKPTGVLSISVPDLEILCRLFLQPNLSLDLRYHIMKWMFGNQMDPFDFHKVGLTFEFLVAFLGNAGFKWARRVESFGLFNDSSMTRFANQPISLNVQAFKSDAPEGVGGPK